ncbi:MAG: helix-turn-helix transcriptional regulator [Gemmatimonadaceae bacterium]|nr:helix-turn-helix transcriptional regulator [Gemmatimonadaceae bacterium]
MRLRAAIGERYDVLTCESWAQLMNTCERKAVATAIIDPYVGSTDQVAFDELRLIKRRFPSVTVVIYLASPATPQHLFELGRFGLDGLVVADHDDQPRRFQALIDQAEARGLTDTLRRAIGAVKPTVRDATLLATTRAHQRLSSASLARILGVRRKVLAERLQQAGFPSPQPLLAWGRLIVAARMLEDPERSADSVAAALEFPSGSAFRNMCQRYLGAAPGDIRTRGGAGYVIAAFLAQIENAAREAAVAELEVAEAELLVKSA